MDLISRTRIGHGQAVICRYIVYFPFPRPSAQTCIWSAKICWTESLYRCAEFQRGCRRITTTIHDFSPLRTAFLESVAIFKRYDLRKKYAVGLARCFTHFRRRSSRRSNWPYFRRFYSKASCGRREMNEIDAWWYHCQLPPKLHIILRRKLCFITNISF